MAGARPPQPQRWLYRYSILVRLTHWMNAVCVIVLVMSGLQIFNAHPALYWGEDSEFDRPIFAISTELTPEGRPVGVTRIFGAAFDTTGVLGRSELNGRAALRAFPSWLTIPSIQDLATGRLWHFFFAWLFVVNGLVYVGASAVSGRLSRELLPTRDQVSRVGATMREHLTFRFHRGAVGYNVLQRGAYLLVILMLAPVLVLSGLTMSPAVVAAAPWLLDLFGGRQSARTVHFIVTALVLAFLFVHVAMVVLSGFLDNMRSMMTGWYAASGEVARDEET